MLKPSAGNGTVWCQVKVFHRMKSLVQLQQRPPGDEVRGTGAGRAAFSLIELLFVMLIIMILFTAMWSFGSKDSQAKRKVRCQAGLQKLFISMQIYAADFSSNFPVVTNATTSNSEQSGTAFVPSGFGSTTKVTLSGEFSNWMGTGVRIFS